MRAKGQLVWIHGAYEKKNCHSYYKGRDADLTLPRAFCIKKKPKDGGENISEPHKIRDDKNWKKGDVSVRPDFNRVVVYVSPFSRIEKQIV